MASDDPLPKRENAKEYQRHSWRTREGRKRRVLQLQRLQSRLAPSEWDKKPVNWGSLRPNDTVVFMVKRVACERNNHEAHLNGLALRHGNSLIMDVPRSLLGYPVKD